MTRGEFRNVVAEVLDSLPDQFRRRMDNVVVLVEDLPAPLHPRTPPPRSIGQTRKLVLGVFVGTPATQQSVFALPGGPARIVLYQKNIEAVCRSEAELRHQIRMTIIHEIGHYFGMDEDQLRHV